MSVGLIYSSAHYHHDQAYHPENAGRLNAVMMAMKDSGLLQRLKIIEPRPAVDDELELVHTADYIERIKTMSQVGLGELDRDTYIARGTFEAACLAAGAAVVGVRHILCSELGSAVAMVRPPGHHAFPGCGGGFCIFNNAAIAARYALLRHGLQRVAIIDFDAHHGNGTQAIFNADGRVLYVSMHQYPHYPGSGDIGERGEGMGSGCIINIPLPAGCGDSQYRMAFSEIVEPAVMRFTPEMIIVSAGYDGHWADELSALRLTVKDFTTMTQRIQALADSLCGGRVLYVLEGGYHFQALAMSVVATLGVMLGQQEVRDPLGQPPSTVQIPDITPLISRVKAVHGL